MIEFTVPGEPRPKERPRFGKRGVYTPRRTSAFERKVQFAALAAKLKRAVGHVAISLQFCLGNARRVDIDNLIKSVLDALNGIAWEDDAQITNLRAMKCVDRDDPRVWICIEEIHEL